MTLSQTITKTLEGRFGNGVQIPAKVALLAATLDEQELTDGTFSVMKTVQVPYFADGEEADIVVIRDGKLAKEEPTHVLGADNPLKLDSPSLDGTMTVNAVAEGSASNGQQTFSVTVGLVDVPEPTKIICQGTNVTCSPGSAPIAGAGAATFAVQVYDTGQLVVTRGDTGESYSMVLTAAAEPAPVESCFGAKSHLCGKLPTVSCDISVMGTAKSRLIAACGNSDAQAFFATAPTTCC